MIGRRTGRKREENVIQVVPTQEEEAEVVPPLEENIFEVVPMQEKENVHLVDCGEVHQQAFDNLDSTIYSVYFREGGRFYGRLCSRCSINLLEFLKKRAPPVFTKEVFFCTKSKTCPYMLCSKCNGMVLLHGP
jgi:hypothetical protein